MSTIPEDTFKSIGISLKVVGIMNIHYNDILQVCSTWSQRTFNNFFLKSSRLTNMDFHFVNILFYMCMFYSTFVVICLFCLDIVQLRLCGWRTKIYQRQNGEGMGTRSMAHMMNLFFHYFAPWTNIWFGYTERPISAPWLLACFPYSMNDDRMSFPYSNNEQYWW